MRNAFIWQQAYKAINGTLTQPCTCHMKALKVSAEINLGNEWDTKDWMEPTHRINTWLKLLYWIQDRDGESHKPAVSPDWNNNEIFFFPWVGFFLPPLLSLARGYFKWDFHSANRLAERRVFHGHPSLHTPLLSSHWLPMRFVKPALAAVGRCSQPMRKEQLLHPFTPPAGLLLLQTLGLGCDLRHYGVTMMGT